MQIDLSPSDVHPWGPRKAHSIFLCCQPVKSGACQPFHHRKGQFRLLKMCFLHLKREGNDSHSIGEVGRDCGLRESPWTSDSVT